MVKRKSYLAHYQMQTRESCPCWASTGYSLSSLCAVTGHVWQSHHFVFSTSIYLTSGFLRISVPSFNSVCENNFLSAEKEEYGLPNLPILLLLFCDLELTCEGFYWFLEWLGKIPVSPGFNISVSCLLPPNCAYITDIFTVTIYHFCFLFSEIEYVSIGIIIHLFFL